MGLARDLEHDVALAVEAFPWVEGCYALASSDASAHPDALTMAVLLSPYGVREVVQTHYAVLTATRSREETRRIMYVRADGPRPTPLARARRIHLRGAEREAAAKRIALRRAAELAFGGAAVEDLEEAVRLLAAEPTREGATNDAEAIGPARSVYRTARTRPLTELSIAELQQLVETTFGADATVLAIERDPFPEPPRVRVLVGDHDPSTRAAFRAIAGLDVTFAEDGWSLIELAAEEEFDLVVLAVAFGEHTGAGMLRMLRQTRPELTSRVVLVTDRVSADAPVFARTRVLTRPVEARTVEELLRG